MDLNEYLWRNGITSVKMSREVDCCHNTIGKIKLHQGSPNLLIALKLYETCDKQIDFIDMLNKRDRELYDKWMLEKIKN